MKMGAQYTAGPWKARVVGNGGYDITPDDESAFVIASRNGYGGWVRAEESKANAHLIAAAPDLLEVLEGFESMVDIWLPHIVSEEHRGEAEALHALRNKALATITKAKGSKP
jgi:hypothetical protein